MSELGAPSNQIMEKSRANALVVIDKHRKRKNLLRRSYLKKIKCVRQNYKPEDVLAAMHAIWRGMSRRQAAKVFNIPRSTLLDKLDGKRPVDASPGPNPFLTEAEERTLEAWAINLYQRGFPLKTEDLKDMAQDVIQNNQRRTSFKNGRPGRSWMRNFLLRHPKVFEISVDMGPGPRRSRTVTTREEVRQWCQYHYQYMVSLGLEDILDNPSRVFNVDHGEFLFDSASGLLLEQERNDRTEDREKADHPGRFSPGVDCVSIVATFSLSSRIAPVMFVYPFQELPQELIETFPSHWTRTYAENGLITGKVFLDYIIAFRHWLEKEKIPLPVLLLVDGRRSRLNMDVTRYCEEQGIILYCLFPTPRPAITELFSSVTHDSSGNINKSNFAVRLNEALNNMYDPLKSNGLYQTDGILPHLQTMVQTLVEIRADPASLKRNYYGLTENGENDESECEFDYELTPVEGEIEMEFPCSENCDPYSLALHPTLVAGSEAPSYVVFRVPSETTALHTSAVQTESCEIVVDRVDQPDVNAHLIVEPITGPLPDTDEGDLKVESEINEVLDTLLSIGTSHQVPFEQISEAPNPSEEPFLGFVPSDTSSHQKRLDADGCLRYMQNFLEAKGLLEDFRAASTEREWNGVPEAKFLFEVWLAALDDTCR